MYECAFIKARPFHFFLIISLTVHLVLSIQGFFLVIINCQHIRSGLLTDRVQPIAFVRVLKAEEVISRMISWHLRPYVVDVDGFGQFEVDDLLFQVETLASSEWSALSTTI